MKLINPGSKPKLRVAFYMTTVLEHGGGMETYLAETARKLSSYEDIEADIFTMDYTITRRVAAVVSILSLKLSKRLLYYPKTTSDVNAELGKAKYIKVHTFNKLRANLSQYDVIYSKNELLEGIVFKFFVGYRNLPAVIFGCHTPIKYPVATSLKARLHNLFYTGIVYKYLANGVTKFHALNSADATQLKMMFKRKPVITIPNPFDFDAFEALADKPSAKETQIGEAPFRIIWVGRLTEQKGVVDLLSLIKSIQVEGSQRNIIWTIVGAGELAYEVTAFAKQYSNIEYRGFMNRKMLANLLLECNLMVNTSKWEGFPYSILEAQAIGLPVVSYDINGPNEIIESGKNGTLVSSINEFEQAIMKYYHGEIKHRNIRQYIRNKYKEETIYSHLIQRLFRNA